MLSNVFYVALVLSVVCNVCQFLYSGSQYQDIISRRTLTSVVPARGEEVYNTKAQTINGIDIPAGTRKIFIDLGANDGKSTSFFLNAENAGGVAVQGGDKGSIMEGMGATGDWEVVAFEANSKHTSKLEAMKKNVMDKNLARSITIYNGTAIAKTTGPITFILDKPVGGGAGATTMSESASAVGAHFTIPGVGIIDLFHTMKIHHDDFVVLKMDIEGAEFEVLRHMITHGLHTRVDVLAVEYHDTNKHVFGKSKGLEAKYKSYHQCIDWMVEDMKTIKVVHWGRR